MLHNTAPDDRTGAADAPVAAWRRWLFPTLALVATLAAVTAFWAARQVARDRDEVAVVGPPVAAVDPGFVGAVIQPARPAPRLAMPAHDGSWFDLDHARGNVVALFFGFTSCPDVCPMTLTHLVYAMRQLGDDAERVRPVFVTVDPDRDSAHIVTVFLRGYDERIVGLVPDAAALRDAASRYGVVYQKDIPAGQPTDTPHYTMTHTASVFLIDPDGLLRAALIAPFTPEDVVHDVRLLLAEADAR